ncbi:aminotransferase class I/II-fold pyridoxal phosphate-dependent enzyme [Sphingobium sp. AN558]|uniref:aminotransferase class I/II-fold pyridoxal phosphate-dependent enzyme n=1 Tax=Sphingobium sp. AN558 TaxID=3133442 RepID=UPI0030BD738E
MNPLTFHGGQLSEAKARYAAAPEPWIDLSTGINPHAWPGADSMDIDWRRLPEERDLRDLERAAARHFGVDPVHVAALPGTEIGLRLLGRLLPGPARYGWPAYRTHAEIFPDARPLASADETPASGGILLLANPNNPDGIEHDAATLLAHLDRQEALHGWLVIDEAFADADPGISLAAHVADDRKLLIFRSFGKYFGLAGLRLGFIIGPVSLVAQIRTLLGSWPVSAAAIAIGTAAYRDEAWIATMREQLPAEAAALDALFDSYGLRSAGKCPLFRLIETGEAGAIFERLAAQAILTRPFDYNPRWLRIGLPGTVEARLRLDRALAHG